MANFSVTISWGTKGTKRKIYNFKTQDERTAFINGVDEAFKYLAPQILYRWVNRLQRKRGKPS